MNAGAAKATGDVLLFLHADSRLPPTAPPRSRRRWRPARRGAASTCASRGRPWILQVVGPAMNWRSRLTGIATGDQGHLRHAARCSSAPAAFRSIPLMEDVALSATLKRPAGRPACLAPRIVTSGRRWEAHGPWRTIFTMWRLRLAYALRRGPGAARAAVSMSAPALLVFAKAPVAGAVKTRLAAEVGAAAALAAYRALLAATLACAAAARDAGIVARVELWCAPDADAPALVELAGTPRLRAPPPSRGRPGRPDERRAGDRAARRAARAAGGYRQPGADSAIPRRGRRVPRHARRGAGTRRGRRLRAGRRAAPAVRFPPFAGARRRRVRTRWLRSPSAA